MDELEKMEWQKKMQYLEEAVKSGEKIQAIKITRVCTNLGLRESKDIVDVFFHYRDKTDTRDRLEDLYKARQLLLNTAVGDYVIATINKAIETEVRQYFGIGG